MIKGSKATLDDHPILASSPVTWSLRAGVNPVSHTFDMEPDEAELLIGSIGRGKIAPTPGLNIPSGSKLLTAPDINSGFDYHITPEGELVVDESPGGRAPGDPGSPGHTKPLILRMEAGGNKLAFYNLFVTGFAPRVVPGISRITVSDRRWLWKYGHIGPRRYNWRRRGGVKRIVDPGTPKTIQDVRDDVWYAGFSLRAEPSETDPPVYKKWLASQVLVNVLQSIHDIERRWNPKAIPLLPGGMVRFEDIDMEVDSVPIENLLLDDSSDKALERVLAYLPGLDIFVDNDGDVLIKDKSSGGEHYYWEKMGAPKVGGGLGEVISNRFRRPRQINVMFTREVELRFDYDELGTLDEQPPGDFEKRLEMKNVVSVPDFSLQLPGHGAVKGRNVAQGTWVNLYEALRAWNQSTNTGGPTPVGWPGFGTLDINFLRRAIVPFIDLWAGVGLAGQTQASADWLGRANALKTHYRRTFQLNSYWWDKILSIKNVRVAILDPETGSRAPSPVYTSFCRLSNERSFYREKFAGVNLNYAINANAYPVGIEGNYNDKSKKYPLSRIRPFGERMLAADAKVNILDPEQGVIQIEYVPDIYHAYDVIIPGQIALPDKNGNVNLSANGVVANAGPSADISNISNSISFDTVMLNSEHQIPEAISDYKVAVILSVIPATWDQEWSTIDKGGERPHGAEHTVEEGVGSLLEVVSIHSSNDRLKLMVSDHVAEGLDDSFGPELDVRVGAGVEVARIAWNDSDSRKIRTIFGVDTSVIDAGPDSGLCINRSDDSSGGSLNEIALSVAARVYSGMVDHVQGSESSDFGEHGDEISPSGWIDEVTFELSTAGEGSIIIDFPEEIEKFDLLSYMDESTRAIIMRLAAQETS